MDMIKKNQNVKNKIWKVRQTIWGKKIKLHPSYNSLATIIDTSQW
jgi:hypothetical protein